MEKSIDVKDTLESFIKVCEPFGITREEATEMWSSYHNLRKINDESLKRLKDF